MDGIRYGDIAKFPTRIKEKFLDLVNATWASQNIPSELKTILMVLLPKPGRDLQLLNSHRPIALLSVYLKTINSMIKTRLEKFISDNALIDDRSYGFIKHRSSINCINHLLSIIKEKMREGYQVMSVFLDLEDAFSNVNLTKLQQINNRLGIPQQYTTWFINCYQNRGITVEIKPANQMKASRRGMYLVQPFFCCTPHQSSR